MRLLVAAVILALCAPALAQTAPVASRVNAVSPSGEGEPNAITCRPPQTVPGSRLLGPEVCRTNAVWAQYRKDGVELTADGAHYAPSEKRRSINMQNCRTPGFTGGGTSNQMTASFGMVCD
jgi:hypothetical protein